MIIIVEGHHENVLIRSLINNGMVEKEYSKTMLRSSNGNDTKEINSLISQSGAEKVIIICDTDTCLNLYKHIQKIADDYKPHVDVEIWFNDVTLESFVCNCFDDFVDSHIPIDKSMIPKLSKDHQFKVKWDKIAKNTKKYEEEWLIERFGLTPAINKKGKTFYPELKNICYDSIKNKGGCISNIKKTSSRFDIIKMLKEK